MTNLSPLDHMLAEHACARLQALYCAHADQGNVEGFVSLFAPSGSVKVPEHPAFVGHEAIRASIIALGASGVTSRHVMTNSLIHVGADHAAGSCYLIVFNSTAAPNAAGWRPMDLPSTVGRYDDEFVSLNGEWKFASRVLTRVFRRMDDPILAAARAAGAKT